jgi:hypothetical protein
MMIRRLHDRILAQRAGERARTAVHEDDVLGVLEEGNQ